MTNRRLIAACLIMLVLAASAPAALLLQHGSTSNIIRVVLKNSLTGQGLTGLSNSSSGLVISTIANNEATATTYTAASSNVETITNLGAYDAPTASKCRFKEVDATYHPGFYEIQLSDARFAVSGAKVLIVSVSGATNLLSTDYEIQLIGYDPTLANLPANVTQISGGSTAADNAEKFFDGTGYGPLLYRTTVDTPTDNQNVSISVPIASNSLVGCRVVLRDVTSTGIMTGVVTGMSGGGDVVVDLDGGAVFTVASGDVVEFLAPAFGGEDRTAATTAQTKVGYLPSATAGATGGVAIVGSNMGTVSAISGVMFPANFATLTITNNAVAANVTHWLGTAAATPTVAGVPEVDITKVLGAEASAVSGAIDVNVVKLIGNEIELTPP